MYLMVSFGGGLNTYIWWMLLQCVIYNVMSIMENSVDNTEAARMHEGTVLSRQECSGTCKFICSGDRSESARTLCRNRLPASRYTCSRHQVQ